jgi:hypothetical protein
MLAGIEAHRMFNSYRLLMFANLGFPENVWMREMLVRYAVFIFLLATTFLIIWCSENLAKFLYLS